MTMHFSTDIYPVMLDDDARYQCQVGPGAQGKQFISFFSVFILKKTFQGLLSE